MAMNRPPGAQEGGRTGDQDRSNTGTVTQGLHVCVVNRCTEQWSFVVRKGKVKYGVCTKHVWRLVEFFLAKEPAGTVIQVEKPPLAPREDIPR